MKVYLDLIKDGAFALLLSNMHLESGESLEKLFDYVIRSLDAKFYYSIASSITFRNLLLGLHSLLPVVTAHHSIAKMS